MQKIALLFISIICASVLHGMEPKEYTSSEVSASEYTSPIGYIISLKKLYRNNIDILIEAIKADADNRLTSILNDRFGDQQEFSAIIHILRGLYNYHEGIRQPNETTEVIAQTLATPAAETYLASGHALLDAAKTGDIVQAKSLIENNADVNFSAGKFVDDRRTNAQHPYYIQYKETSPLTYAIIYGRLEIVKLLLETAFPESNYYYKFNGYYPPEFNTAFGVTGTKKDRKEIQKMIDQARWSQEESYDQGT